MAEPDPLGGRLPAVAARVPAAPAAAAARVVAAASARSRCSGGRRGRSRRRRAVLGVVFVIVVVVREELALWIRDGKVAEDVLRGKGVLLEVVVLKCNLGCDSLRGVHDEELLEEHERFAVGLYAVPVHVLHERAIDVTEIDSGELDLGYYVTKMKKLPYFVLLKSLVRVGCSGIFRMSSQSLSCGNPMTENILKR